MRKAPWRLSRNHSCRTENETPGSRCLPGASRAQIGMARPWSVAHQSPTFDAASVAACAALDAVFLAVVVVALALLFGAADDDLAVVDAVLAVFLAAVWVAPVTWVWVVLAFAEVVSAELTAAWVDCWWRIRSTRVSPRSARSA